MVFAMLSIKYYFPALFGASILGRISDGILPNSEIN